MEGSWVFLVIVMIVASLIDQVAKAGKKGKPGEGPPQRRPPARRPAGELPGSRPRLPEGQRRPTEVREARDVVMLPSPTSGEGRASEMIAEDFWRELTGQPPVRRPPPLPTPEPEAEEEGSWDEALRTTEAPPPETAPGRQPSSWDYRRSETVHEAPVIVSLETPIASPEARYAAYQRRLEALPAAPTVSAGPARSQLLRRVRNGKGLRESVLMAEIFCPPRSLEEFSPDR